MVCVDTAFNAKAGSRVSEGRFYGLEYFIPTLTVSKI